MEFQSLHDEYLAKYKPLLLESSQAWWEANTTGSDEAFARKEKAEQALVELHSDPTVFARLEKLKDTGLVRDPKQARMLDVMYRTYLPGQADAELQKKIVALETQVDKSFNTYRSQVGDRTLTENDVRKVISDSANSEEVKQAWLGYMAVGRKVEDLLRQLVRLRNQMARQLGFRDYFVMKLELGEVDERELMRIFDDLDGLTSGPFAVLKRRIDENRAKQFGIATSDLRAWHFGDLFFQESPDLTDVNLDTIFEGQDLLSLAKRYYNGIGTPCEDIISRSDLYEKPGKTQHAFATDMDREGDIRIVCNIKSNAKWMDTVLHELGHAIYDKYLDKNVPFVLREASHSITTEGVAMMFGAMARNRDWLVNVREVSPTTQADWLEAARLSLQAERLIFCRWTQVVVRFEKSMYANPEQDLAKLWWDLKAKYQLMPPPDDRTLPGYAAKIHVITHPVYYQNYMLGELFASQVQHYIATTVLKVQNWRAESFEGRPEAGRYLQQHIFAPADLYSWNELTRRATGEPLTPRYYAQQYVEGLAAGD